MVRLTLSPLHPLFGAEIVGGQALLDDPGLPAVLERAIGKHGLLLIRDVDLDDDGLARFAARFGPLQNMAGRADVERHVIRVSNLSDYGTLKASDDPSRLQHDANRLWHTDSSFLSPGALYSFLHGRIVTHEGGDTQFCDTRVAWEALAPAQQARLEGLSADHSMRRSWRLMGIDPATFPAASRSPVRRPLAPIHPPSGRRALMIPSHVAAITGMRDTGRDALLAELTAIATDRTRVHAHRWRPGDLLIWDNRCMLHRVMPYPDTAPRDLRSCRVIDAGDGSRAVTERAPEAAALWQR